MSIRRLVLDVDKTIARPDLLELAAELQRVRGVEGVNITVTEVDVETMGLEVTVEDAIIDYDGIVRAIETTGAVLHGIDQLVVGSRMVERVRHDRAGG